MVYFLNFMKVNPFEGKQGITVIYWTSGAGWTVLLPNHMTFQVLLDDDDICHIRQIKILVGEMFTSFFRCGLIGNILQGTGMIWQLSKVTGQLLQLGGEVSVDFEQGRDQ